LQACQKIALDPVPCLLRDDLGNVDAVTLSFVENVHRADMNPLDKAHALKALYDQHHDYERVARETAWSVSTVRRYIRLLSLPDALQKRLGTMEGPLGIGALSRLAGAFSGDDAVEVYDKISGFTPRIQDEILKRSDGNVDKIDDLVEEAHEGAFDVRRCGGAYGCEIIRDVWEHRLNQRDFQGLVLDIASSFDASELAKRRAREAARAFWKALATNVPEQG
jgi:ParB family chromosome partitioning protein